MRLRSNKDLLLFTSCLAIASTGYSQVNAANPFETLLSVNINIQRILEVEQQNRPADAIISDEEAAKMDMIKRLELSNVEIHLVPDAEELFAIVIGIQDTQGKIINEMTNTELGKKFFISATDGTIRPNWDAMPKGSEEEPPPPAQIKNIVFKQMGQYIVASSPKMMQRIVGDTWNITHQVTYQMTNKVKLQNAVATVAVALPAQRSMDWLEKIKNQPDIKDNFGAAMMVGMMGGMVSKVMEKLQSTDAVGLSFNIDSEKNRQVQFSQLFKTPDAAKGIIDLLNTPAADLEEGPAKSFAETTSAEGITKSLTQQDRFMNLSLQWPEKLDYLFQRSSKKIMRAGAPKPPPPPPPSNNNEPPVDSEGMTLEQKLPLTTPLEITTEPVTIGDKQVQAEVFKVVGKQFLSDDGSMKLFKDVEVIGTRLYTTTEKGEITAFNITEGTPPTLTLDTSFGEQGVLQTNERIERLLRNAQGLLIGSTWSSALFIDSTGKVVKKVNTSGNIAMHPTEAWGVTYSFNGLNIVTFDGQAFQPTKLELTPATPVEGDKDAFSFISPVIVYGDKLAVGCQVPEGDKQSHCIVVFDKTGKELFRFGNTKDVFELDGFCYLHDLATHANGFVTVDSNCRKVAFWDKEGKFIGGGKADDMLGVRYPWIPGCTVDDAGTLYIALAQEREPIDPSNRDIDVAEGIIYRVKGF